MEKIEEFSSKLIESLESKDFERYKRCRNLLVSEVIDEMLILKNIQDFLLVGKALTIISDDLAAKNHVIYKRVILTAVYCLLSVLLKDKNDAKHKNAFATALLLIIFTENEDFLATNYFIDKFVNVQKAAEQYTAMQCVFYWIYKLSNYPVNLDARTGHRVLNTFTKIITQIPDEAQRKRLIDFEYGNFESIVQTIDIDLALKYPGIDVMMSDYEITMSRIGRMFKATSLYFTDSTDSNIDPRNRTPNPQPSRIGSATMTGSNIPARGNNNGGCFSIILIAITFAIASILI